MSREQTLRLKFNPRFESTGWQGSFYSFIYLRVRRVGPIPFQVSIFKINQLFVSPCFKYTDSRHVTAVASKLSQLKSALIRIFFHRRPNVPVLKIDRIKVTKLASNFWREIQLFQFLTTSDHHRL